MDNTFFSSSQMASYLLKLPIQIIKTQNVSTPCPASKTHFPSLPIPLQPHHSRFTFFPQRALCKSHIPALCALKDQPTYTPPTSKEEAILQAKTCLSLCLEKPLNNPRLAGKLKKQKQPRYRVEIPVIDVSAESLAQLAFQLFSELPIKKKGAPIKILILWSNATLTKQATEAFELIGTTRNSVANSDISSATEGDASTRILNSADVAVFLAPEASQLNAMKTISSSFYPKPLVVFNPKWSFEEESGFGELTSFVGSFEVAYAFMGLEVRGLLSKRQGVVFRSADGRYSDEGWAVLVEEEKGQLNMVTKFKKRPSIGEVENVLYNKMAVNSPVTKSVKFLRDLVSNVTGKKDG